MNSVLENDFVKALAMVIKLDGKKKNIKQHVEMAYKDLNTKVEDWDKKIRDAIIDIEGSDETLELYDECVREIKE